MVVDASVLLAILFAEPKAEAAADALDRCSDDLAMSTVNLAEVLIRFGDRHPERMAELEARLPAFGLRFVPPDVEQARIVAQARLRWPLNLGDCFAYALAVAEGDAILTADKDFRCVDVKVVWV